MKERIRIIGFTDTGCALAKRLLQFYEGAGAGATVTDGRGKGVLSAFVRDYFRKDTLLVFVGAAGIAVRAIAPYVKDKLEDPAVLVLDETGRFVIPLLSGHVGGANEAAADLAAYLGAEAVLTTASDVHHLPAIDVIAKENGLAIADYEAAKRFAASFLQHRRAGVLLPEAFADVLQIRTDEVFFHTQTVSSERLSACVSEGRRSSASGHVPEEGLPCCMVTPEQLTPAAESPGDTIAGRETNGKKAPAPLHLIPRCVVIGMGCRKRKDAEALFAFCMETLAALSLDPRAVCALCSVDVKCEEQGLLALAKRLEIPFLTFSAEELNETEGTFAGSAFVESTVGTDNVCERAAVKGGAVRLIQKKTARDGMTIAVGLTEKTILFS
ncbi:MAG: cobalamin biosynthesis protein [Lachnospiraceae bacterium]|nr:cobalamin biosynthesis protein [Lachnospiraceae bacterium]